MAVRKLTMLLACGVVLYLLIGFTVSVFVVKEAAVAVLHVPEWVPYLTASIFLVCLWMMSKDLSGRRWIWCGITILALTFFVLSLRVIKFYAYDGRISEEIALHEFPIAAFPGTEVHPPCFTTSNWTLRLKSSQFESAFFRGVWPSYFGDSNIKARFLGMERCQ
jgi:hypothetical protein